MKPHPHAEVLRAIADGVPLDEFEGMTVTEIWYDLDEVVAVSRGNGSVGWITEPDRWQIRRKPQHIIVNGFKVPKPLDVMPQYGQIYYPALDEAAYYAAGSTGAGWVCICLQRGIAHATKEAAIAHAKAMLGIDPEYFK